MVVHRLGAGPASSFSSICFFFFGWLCSVPIDPFLSFFLFVCLAVLCPIDAFPSSMHPLHLLFTKRDIPDAAILIGLSEQALIYSSVLASALKFLILVELTCHPFSSPL